MRSRTRSEVSIPFFNGAGHGSVASQLLATNGDFGVLRPFIDKHGRHCITVNGKTVPTRNASGVLRYDEWRAWDNALLKAARARLTFVNGLRAGGLQFTVPNGLGKTVLSSENSTDPGDATISMDGVRKGNADRPEYGLNNLPLPIIHSDFDFSARELMVSRNGGSPYAK